MLKDQVSNLPNLPGIYQYFDEKGKLLYVGKAKILKNRVKSYFEFTPNFGPNRRNSARIIKMVSEARNLEFIVTSSESDALILENSFIKQLHPKYNILLRDDKTYPYIYIDLNENFPRFKITRKVVKGTNIRYFGPYFKGAKEILEALYFEFPLVQKNSCQKGKKSCIFYQMNRCKAPCENKISIQNYKIIVDEAIKAIKNPQILVPNLTNLMMNFANNENYEEAAKIRDLINLIKETEFKVELDLAKLEDFEVFSIANKNGFICVTRFSIRDGKVNGANFELIKFDDEISLNEIYKQAILKAFPKEIPTQITKIYTNDNFEDLKLIEEFLSKIHNKNFKIIAPKIGDKKQICLIAQKNAILNITKNLKQNDFEILQTIKQTFNLSNLPVVIEGFDNSHLFGAAPVGACVGFSLGKWIKDRYRHFHLKTKNDFDQMRETLTTRALRFDKVSPPDLWIIDGGEVLRNLAIEILKNTGSNVDVIAISKEKIDAKAHRAKGKAKDKIYAQNGVFEFDENSKILQFIQKIRDESHRFAISFHKKTREKFELNSSQLKQIGLNDGNIQKLIDYYGNFEEIYKADLSEIKQNFGKKIYEKMKLIKD